MTIDHITAPAPLLNTSPYQRSVAAYWNAEKNPVNLRLGDVDGIYHHHYGIGDVDWSVLDASEDMRENLVTKELHRLECNQTEFLLDQFGAIGPEDRLLDAGSGRGGGSIVANQRFGCSVDGVSISQSQVDFANDQAVKRGVDDKVRFHLKNMLSTGFDSGTFRGIWNNESTMYVDLAQLFAEHSRLLARGGRYVTITGCYNDTYGLPSRAVSQINAHYICDIHPRSTYFKEMAANRLVPISVVDLTSATIPYWELRAKSSLVTGIEDPFLTAYKDGSFQYLLIAADRV
ncbi:methyltransferase domain-containing protein [Streptomyces sp. So13.3]|uniref:geranyl diphosphate 2-C-methyltransferase n=1 Tax=Streptomyces TaxID=1883 RepID=UPI0011072560|nr:MULTISPECIES: geranyl diphosphate 2-C-methyltransferase [Streptomyces]MCZ4097968.1 methyltransferase domain-containing protein [Streptomyces sp. H39-C1]QNA71710.1 methyltransferase domain-containing protein [Streptomyces sp. So13.3]